MKRLSMFLILATLAGCETAITPIVGTDQPYTLFGYVGAERDTQRVHVIPVRNQLDLLDPSVPIDAVVTSTNLDTGVERLWNDSLVFFSDDSWAHVFWSEFRATPMNTYSIKVRRSDGRVSSATTTIPTAPTATIEDPTILGARLVNQRVRWSPAIRLVDVVVEYDVSPFIPGMPGKIIQISYPSEMAGDDWIVDLNLTTDYEAITAQFPGTPVILNGIRMNVFSVNDTWLPPGGVFDFELLSEPGTLDNVENGFGFVGAGVRESAEWLPDSLVLSTIGFVFR